MFLGATAGWAQSSLETAVEAVPGQDNTYETTEVDSVFWKYTASQNELIYVGPKSGDYYSNIEVYGTTDDTTPTTSNVMKAGQDGRKYIYPVREGQTVYFMGYGEGSVGFNLSTKAIGSLGHGLTEDDPLTIELDTIQYLGNAYATGYSSYDMYTTYTAEEDGQLVITTKAYFSSFTVNGTSYKADNAYVDGAYQYTAKAAITAGQTYKINFYGYQPMVFTAAIAHPAAGSEEMPFELTEGENTVPADFGTYYYTYTPGHKGYMTFTSDEALTGGNVAVYQSKSYMGYGNATATSPTGSFNVRAEVKYYYASSPSTYWVKITKTEATDTAQKFNFSMDEYQQGETQDNPIAIEVPDTVTLPNASGSTYYSVNVPANTNKFLVVQALTSVSQNTGLYVYASNDSYNATTSTTGYAKADVSNTTDNTYIIRWNANETEAFQFSVTYQDIAEGSTITNPLTAVLGENTLQDNGTQYYKYTATKDGKLSVTFDNANTTAAFPQGTGKWDGEYDTSVSGATYSIEATQGTTYLITVTDAVKDEKFTLAEADFAEGESQNNPLYVDSTYTLGANSGYATWIAYRATMDGKVSVNIENVEVSPWDDNVTFGKSTDELQSLMNYSVDPTTGDYIYEFKGSVAVSEGDVVLVNLKKLTYATAETKVVFTIGEQGPGETKAKAYQLVVNTPIEVGTPSASAPIWCKIVGNGEAIQLKSNNDVYGYWYTGEDLANEDAEDYDNYFSVDHMESLEDGTYYYLYDRTVTEANVHYLKLIRTWGVEPITLTLLAGQNADVTDAIGTVNAQANAAAEVYNLNGQKVADKTAGLKAGIYIVSQNGKTQKVIVK